MKETDSGFKFTSGRVFNPNRGIIGLAKDGDGIIKMYGGYDERFATEHNLYKAYGDGCEEWGMEADLSVQETKEIALYMIKLWTELYNEVEEA